MRISNINALKKQKRALRTAFTRVHTNFLAKLNDETSNEEKTVAFQFLRTKMTELDRAHASFNKALFESTLTDDEITKELESDDFYKTTYLSAKMKISFAPASGEVIT